MSKDLFPNNDSEWRLVENNFELYGLKVPVKSQGSIALIDIASAINSDQHYIQQGLNYCKSLIAGNITGSYNVSSSQLLGILATAAEINSQPWTSDAGPFTDSWWMISMWVSMNGYSYDDVLCSFKQKYPDCSKIILTISNSDDTQIAITINNDHNIDTFGQLNIQGATIDLSHVEIV